MVDCSCRGDGFTCTRYEHAYSNVLLLHRGCEIASNILHKSVMPRPIAIISFKRVYGTAYFIKISTKYVDVINPVKLLRIYRQKTWQVF